MQCKFVPCALQESRGSKTEAAKLFGIKRPTLHHLPGPLVSNQMSVYEVVFG
ncbi:MAG: helix-turn-helix domain-containing protein [Syntrophobacteraceae bacterium]